MLNINILYFIKIRVNIKQSSNLIRTQIKNTPRYEKTDSLEIKIMTHADEDSTCHPETLTSQGLHVFIRPLV
jgi:hypothetical protein